MSDLAQLIVALSTLITAMAGATATVLLALRSGKKIDAVHQEVRTLNESTLGQLGAATETRRIEAKEAAHHPLTAREQRHIDAANGGEA